MKNSIRNAMRKKNNYLNLSKKDNTKSGMVMTEGLVVR